MKSESSSLSLHKAYTVHTEYFVRKVAVLSSGPELGNTKKTTFRFDLLAMRDQYYFVFLLLLTCTSPAQNVEGLYNFSHQSYVENEIGAIQREFWAWRLREYPEFASFAGFNQHSDRADRVDLTTYTRNKDYISGLVERLDSLKSWPSFKRLSRCVLINHEVLSNTLGTYVAGYKWHLYTVGNPVNFLEGPQVDIRYYFQTTSLTSRQDFENFFNGMKQFSNKIDDMIVLMREAIISQYTNHNVSMNSVIGQIDKILQRGLECEWFTLLKERVKQAEITSDYKETLLRNARDILKTVLLPAYRKMKVFLKKEYLPRTRPGLGVSTLSNGDRFYEAALRWHLTLDMAPNEVHALGLREVARIAKRMQRIMDRHNFTGALQEFLESIRNKTYSHFKTKRELLDRYKDIIYNHIVPRLELLFEDIPDMPLIIQTMPNDGPAGEYRSGSVEGRRPAVFEVNFQHPESLNTFDMTTLALHETFPGHHLQNMYAQTSPLPMYRKIRNSRSYYRVPFHFPIYTAYVEGWGLYAEYLGEEIGVYKDDFELLGRLSAEMLRACRLVVDTGIHMKGWTRDQAVEYILKYSHYSRHNVELEVDRYITWPGQACAYKIGELKFRELKEMAARKLGRHFDLREFHSVVLTAGALPLDILTNIVNDWIQDRMIVVKNNSFG